MITLWFLLLISCITAFFVEIKNKKETSLTVKNKSGKVIIKIQLLHILYLSVLCLTLSLFSGLRVSYNDTATYIYNYMYKIPNTLNNFTLYTLSNLSENPGFLLFQILIKKNLSSNPQFFIFVTSLITNSLFIMFYNKYSYKFSLSVFMFITSGLFIFGMAAVKQMLAMGIGLWFIDSYLSKKNIKSILILVLASTIHPFILFFIFVIFLKGEVWSKNINIFLLLLFILGSIFNIKFMSSNQFSNSFIAGNSLQYLMTDNKMSVLRILFFSMVPLLSFIHRDKINIFNNTFINISINFSIVSFIFMAIGYFGNANTFGRLGNYFEPFVYISLPWLMINSLNNNKYKKVLNFIIILSFFIFFIYQFSIAKPFIYDSILTHKRK